MFRTIRARLYLLVGLSIAAFLALAVHTAWSMLRVRREAELVANLELARTSAAAVRAFVEDVHNASGALGRAIAGGHLPEPDAVRLLADAAGDYPAVREIAWIDPDGRVTLSSNPASVGLDMGGRRYFQAIAAGDDSHVSDLVQARVDGQPVFVIARAIRPVGGGALTGVVIAVVIPELLAARVLPAAREGDAALAIVDRAGRIAFRAPALELDWDARLIGGAQPLVEQALAGREATGTVRAETGDERLGAAVPIPPFGWAVRASRSKAEALGPVRRQVVLGTAGAALVSLLALMGSGLVGARTVGAIRRLERHATRLGRGERPSRPLAGPEEIQRLGRAYEEMAAGLFAAQHRFQAVFDQAPAGVLVLDRDLRARYANRCYLSYLDPQFQTGGIEGLALDAFLPPAVRDGVLEAARKIARDGGTYEEAERRIEGFARGPAWFRWSIRQVPSEDGQHDLVLLASEVTEQVTAREQVEADRRRLEAVLRTLPAGVFIADAGGQLVHANDEARRIWGGAAPIRSGPTYREYRGRRADTGAPLEPGDWPLQRALRTGETTAGELIEIDRFDGTRGTILSSAAPIRDGESRITGAVAAMLDVTELRRAVRNRDELLQVVSHDLRNPLASVSLGAATLGRLPDGLVSAAQVRRTAGRIASAGKRMTRLIEDLLDLTALEDGRLGVELTSCDPTDLLGEAAEEIGEAAREKGLDLCLSAAPGLPAVECDRGRVLQILANVVANAIKATERGAVCLAAEARDGEVVFRVRDTGPGIPEADLPYVFDRFRRSTDALWRGTGLGLAIARGLVEAQGGRIWAESAPGEGATVSFTLRTAPADVADRPATTAWRTTAVAEA